MSMRPVFVDLDRCLIKSDTLHESIIALFRKSPFHCLLMPLWLLKGKAAFKHIIASKVEIDPKFLPYNKELLIWLKEKSNQGHPLYLATAANERIAKAVSDHLNMFDGYFASSAERNLSGKEKKHVIKTACDKYDYVGDSIQDLHVWGDAEEIVVVGNRQDVRQKLSSHPRKKIFIDTEEMSWAVLLNAVRAHQWAKNLLVFVPMLLAHKFNSPAIILNALIAFCAFSLVASAAYLVNDLLDLEVDRQHQSKCKRPLASGSLSLAYGAAIAAVFFVAGFSLSLWRFPAFALMLLGYFLITLLYSAALKKVFMLDVLTLGSLYAWRILSGGVATDVEISPWLVSFSTFFFLSLALSKRSSELSDSENDKSVSNRRGYIIQDLPMINAMGVSAAMASMVIISLYIYSPKVTSLYAHPQVLWGEVLLLTYWIGRIWILTGRGQLHQDPVEFAIKDLQSYVICLLMLFIAAIGAGFFPIRGF